MCRRRTAHGELFCPRRKSPTSVWRPFMSSTGKIPRSARALRLHAAAGAAAAGAVMAAAGAAGVVMPVSAGAALMPLSAAAAPLVAVALSAAVRPLAGAAASAAVPLAVARWVVVPLLAVVPAEAAALAAAYG